jgi:hypothetical protein
MPGFTADSFGARAKGQYSRGTSSVLKVLVVLRVRVLNAEIRENRRTNVVPLFYGTK